MIRLVLMIGLETWRSTCATQPQECQEKIVAMTAQERADLNAIQDRETVARLAYEKLSKQRDAVADSIVKSHHMDKLPAIVDHHGLNGIIGGTCLGGIDFNPDGYIVYHPASDIQSCGKYK